MSGLADELDTGDPLGVFGGLSDVEGSLSGRSGIEAARQAALIQEELGREALAEQEASQLRLEETLAPFVGFGVSKIPEFQRLFQPTVSQSIAASPTVSGLQDLGSAAVADNPFLANLSPQALEASQLRSGIDLLSRERGDLLSAIALGQASGAQEAAGGLQTGGSRADLLSQIGNVQAAGLIGGAQAGAQGAQNMAALGTTIAGLFRK